MLYYEIIHTNPETNEVKIKILSRQLMLDFLEITNNQFNNMSRAKNLCYKNRHLKNITIKRLPVIKKTREYVDIGSKF